MGHIPPRDPNKLPAVQLEPSRPATSLVDDFGLIYSGRDEPIGAPPPADEVQWAADWLASRAKAAKTARDSSYGIKHAIEDMTGRYISNGSMILAAHRAGFRQRPTNGPNSLIYMKFNF